MVVAWYFYDWTGTFRIVQEGLLPELRRICGVVFDDEMTPLRIPSCEPWVLDLFLQSAVRPRPEICVVFGPNFSFPTHLLERYQRVYVYVTSPLVRPIDPPAVLPTGYLVPSQWVKDNIPRELAEITTVVPHGVDPTIFYPPTRKSESSELKVLTVTSSAPQKRIDTVVECFKQAFPKDESVRLTIKVPRDIIWYGRHELPIDLVKNAVNDSRIVFDTRPLSRKELGDLYREHDVFLYGSEAESFCLSVAEARACKLPLVVRPVAAVAEQLRDENNIEFSPLRLQAMKSKVVRAAAVPVTRPLTWAESARLLVEAVGLGKSSGVGSGVSTTEVEPTDVTGTESSGSSDSSGGAV
jgi:glycosyltransferase involved in cell wall biosynthesis